MKTSIRAPWIVGWSNEQITEARPCPHASGRLATWAPDHQGEGVPNFRHLHPVRSRMAVARNLCVVCGRALKADRYMFPLGSWDLSPRGMIYILFGGMVHHRCALSAQKLCPAIRRTGAGPKRACKMLGIHTDVDDWSGQKVASLNRYMISEPNARRVFGDDLDVPWIEPWTSNREQAA